MTAPRYIGRGRIRHGHNSVAVPVDIRLEVFRRWPTGEKASKALAVSPQTAYAILAPGGVVRVDVLERVRERLKEAS